MNQIINDFYQSAFSPALKDHLLHGMGFCEEDQEILRSLFEHSGDSEFHYDDTSICRARFERRLRNINRVVLPELVRLANRDLAKETQK